MSVPRNDADRPRAEPATQQSGNDRRRDLRGKDAPGSADTSGADEEDDDAWRHEPVAPIDEQNPLKSLGRAVADTITGGAEGKTEKPKR